MRSLTLRIPKRTKATDDYVLEVFRWRNGEIEKKAAGRIPLGEKNLGLEKLSQLILTQAGDSQEFRKEGITLYEVLHRGKVAEVWDKERQAADTEIDQWSALSPSEKEVTPKPDGLRLYFAIEDPSLAAVPWELIQARSEFPVFFQEEHPALRCEASVLRQRQDAKIWPIRVLVIEGCSEAEAKEIGSKEEIEGIREALRPVSHFFDLELLQTRAPDPPGTVTPLPPVTPDTLRIRLKEFKPHILHFIGHGTAAGDKTVLKICNKENDVLEWPANQIGLAVRNMGGILRLAIINACRSGVAADSDAPSIARALFKGTALSVVAMQADLSGKAAQICVREFYRALARGRPIDKALSVARQAMSDELGEEKRHAFVPVLYVRALPEQILLSPAHSGSDSIIASDLDEVRRSFVNRTKQRSETINAMFETGLEIQRRSAVVINGGEKFGKTWLCKWLLHACAAAGTSVHWLDAFNMADWLEVLITICAGKSMPDSFTRPLPKPAQAAFYKALTQIAGIRLPRSGTAPRVTLKDLEKQNNAQDMVMSAFHAALKTAAAAGTGNLVIAIDRLRQGDQGLSDPHFESLHKYLWERIAQERDGPIKVMVILPGMEKDSYKVQFSEALWKKVDVGTFPAAEVPALLRELVLSKFPQQADQFSPLFNLRPADIMPGDLVNSCNAFAKLLGL
jgi:hypothetical protein